jgi:hypothetical protein
MNNNNNNNNTIKTLLFLLSIISVNAQSWNQLGVNILGTGLVNLLGRSTAISGDGSTAAIGAPKQNPSGEVQVYHVTDTGYSQKGSPILGTIPGEDFGWSISLSKDGNSIIVGAPDDSAGNNDGHAYVYQWNGNNWIDKGSTLAGNTGDDQFGWDVDISSDGNTIAVSAPLSDQNAFNNGDVKIYSWSNNDWSTTSSASLFGNEAFEEFGKSLALSEDGKTIVIGSPFDFGSYNTGLTRVYFLNGTQWQQQGEDLYGVSLTEHSGFSVDISNDGNRIAAGSFSSSEGLVRIFEWNGTNWDQLGEKIKGVANFDSFGYSLSLNGDGSIVAAGAPSNDANGSNSGHVKVFRLVGDTWTERGQDIEGDTSSDRIGTAVSLSDDGNKIIMGGAGNPNNGNFEGRAKLFLYEPTTATNSINNEHSIRYGPNPTDSRLMIDLGQTFEEIQVEVQSITGQIISNQIFKNTAALNLDINGNSGWYVLNIKLNSKTVKTIKIFKTDF